MISKFLSKLKSILFKSSVSTVTPVKTAKKTIKSSQTSKTKAKPKAKAKPKPKAKAKPKAKKDDAKKIIENLTTIPGVGAKSAKAFYEAGFKTTKAVISAADKELLAVPGVGINLVKKLKKLK